ncbi:MAG: acetylxylan esterase [Chloroflexi bacterium]|nr:acetylxylan esterase [Chloroflexota bacterium]
MTQTPQGFDSYWQGLTDEVSALAGGHVEIEEVPLRTNEVATAYGITFSGTGDYPLFAYLTVPRGKGPFPALLQTPAYGSVVGVPAHERRARYVVVALCHRGQRLADSVYSAEYPGLLTDGLPDASTYRWREIVADCLRALDVLKDRPEADTSRIAVSGGDLAAITAALRPEVRYLLLSGLIFRGASARIPELAAYPDREFADYVRNYPEHADRVAETLSLFDPLAFAPNIRARTLVTGVEGARALLEPLVEAISGDAEFRVNTGRSHLDHEAEETWLTERLGVL